MENFQDLVSFELALTNPYISHMLSMGSFRYVNINPNQVFHLNEPAAFMLQKRFNSLGLFGLICTHKLNIAYVGDVVLPKQTKNPGTKSSSIIHRRSSL